MTLGRPPKYSTPEEMQRVIDMYFDGCLYNLRLAAGMDLDTAHSIMADYSEDEIRHIERMGDMHPSVSGLSYMLGMSRQALCDYSNKDDFLDTVKRAKQRVEMALEQRLFQQGPVGAIFNLKNNFGWKDKTEQELSGHIGVSQVERKIVKKT